MAKVLMHVSGYYDGDTLPAGEVAVVDGEYARRAVLLGHADLLVDGAPVDFAAACERLRIAQDEVDAWAGQRAAALAEREG